MGSYENTMSTYLYGESIPSERTNFLLNLRYRVVDKLTRCSLESAEELRKYEAKGRDAFSLTAGPLLIHFEDGLVLGMSSNPSLNSVVLWIEKNEAGKEIAELSEQDEDYTMMDAGDHSLWAGFLNRKISNIKIIKWSPSNAKMEDLPNEVGVDFVFEGGGGFIAAHRLHESADDFSVISREDMPEELAPLSFITL